MSETENGGPGRPSEYDPQFLLTAKDYLDNYELKGDVVPTIEGLADVIGKGTKTIYNWGKDHEAFQVLLDRIMAKQGRVLQNKGLRKETDSGITKLLLSANHGKREKTDVTSDDKPIESGVIYLPEKKPEGHGA